MTFFSIAVLASNLSAAGSSTPLTALELVGKMKERYEASKSWILEGDFDDGISREKASYHSAFKVYFKNPEKLRLDTVVLDMLGNTQQYSFCRVGDAFHVYQKGKGFDSGLNTTYMGESYYEGGLLSALAGLADSGLRFFGKLRISMEPGREGQHQDRLHLQALPVEKDGLGNPCPGPGIRLCGPFQRSQGCGAYGGHEKRANQDQEALRAGRRAAWTGFDPLAGSGRGGGASGEFQAPSL
jgi:hypothetical protein